MSDRYVPKLAGFFLNILGDIEDSVSKGIANKEIPYSNRNLLIDTGKNMQVVSFTCVFMDPLVLSAGMTPEDGFLPTYNNHDNFLNVIDDESLTFVHPTYGEMKGSVKSSTIKRDSTKNYVEITITFWREIKELTSNNFKFIVEETSKAFRDATKSSESKLNFIQRGLNEIAFDARMNAFTNELNTLFSDITSPADSIINSISYAESTAGGVVSSINQMIDRMVEAFRAVNGSPSNFINNLVSTTRALQSGFTGIESDLVGILGVARTSVEAAETYVADEENQSQADDLIDQETFDNSGNYVGGDEVIEVMTVNELEETVSEVRRLINDIVQIYRDNLEIQIQAKDLQKYVDQNKLNRDIIKEVATNKKNIYDLIYEYDGSYQTADRILKLNPQIRKPNFMVGSVNVMVKSV